MPASGGVSKSKSRSLGEEVVKGATLFRSLKGVSAKLKRQAWQKMPSPIFENGKTCRVGFFAGWCPRVAWLLPWGCLGQANRSRGRGGGSTSQMAQRAQRAGCSQGKGRPSKDSRATARVLPEERASAHTTFEKAGKISLKPEVWPWRLAQYAWSRLVPSKRPVRSDKRSLRSR